ncbi:coproporphyrinogen dehydrogenase HemZ [Anaeroselena agilis]|uniref:Coproporphyrinogen dehydrogenase HemZ n=1 Tax=Anaeroselena agilis TaxID=3063788 RepID=A0ABU3NW35_9FIRM|nr:coproporphyrinogen dehydrogenase HemZ [Selenomonadales bacterium 4137-cl]
MKVNGYYLPAADDGLAGAVADAATLFSIPAAGVLAGGDIDALLPADAVFIRNTVTGGADKAVVTEVFFRREDGALGCHTRRAREGDEEAAAAAQRLVRLNLLAILKLITGRNPGPWGILRGVRPIKIVHRLLDNGLSLGQAADRLAADYAVEPDKARLIAAIGLRQRPFLHSGREGRRLVSVYVGVPYCPSRCLYCSFPANVLPADHAKVAAFLSALETDIAAAADLIARRGLAAETVYIGGGTPTSLGDADFARLLEKVRGAFVSAATREFTVEAGRPDCITDNKVSAMATSGVTRVSVNPQTMQEKTLKLIGRNHTVRDIIVMFRKIRSAGIPIINMDIIAGLPEETERDMAATMADIAALAPDNITVHTLAIKRGSRLAAGCDGVALPDERTTAAMMAIAADGARAMGQLPYYLYRQKYMTGNLENVGYALPGAECIYNIQIIEERQTIIGVGPAAATKAVAADYRLDSCYNPKDVATYIANIDHYIRRREELLAALFSR